MPNLCVGTAQFGMDYGVANSDGKPSFKKIVEMVDLLQKNNVVYFDTAQAYGDSEQVLGQSFSALKLQHKVKCITKLAPDFTFEKNGDLESASKYLSKIESDYPESNEYNTAVKYLSKLN